MKLTPEQFAELLKDELSSMFTEDEIATTTEDKPEQPDTPTEETPEETLVRLIGDERVAEFHDEDGFMLPSHPEYCSSCHVLKLLDQVMINTLSTASKVTPESAQTMLVLSTIREKYLAK